jgi:hypothetical protein
MVIIMKREELSLKLVTTIYNCIWIQVSIWTFLLKVLIRLISAMFIHGLNTVDNCLALSVSHVWWLPLLSMSLNLQLMRHAHTVVMEVQESLQKCERLLEYQVQCYSRSFHYILLAKASCKASRNSRNQRNKFYFLVKELWNLYIYIYIYIYTVLLVCVCVYIFTYKYIYIHIYTLEGG